jgi:NADH:ubiquinone oxidoreductase subunit F (NADH-binding)
MSKTEKEKDRLFIQEIINDLKKHGYQEHGKAATMLNDWSRELAEESGLRGRTKRSFKLKVGLKYY